MIIRGDRPKIRVVLSDTYPILNWELQIWRIPCQAYPTGTKIVIRMFPPSAILEEEKMSKTPYPKSTLSQKIRIRSLS